MCMGYVDLSWILGSKDSNIQQNCSVKYELTGRKCIFVQKCLIKVSKGLGIKVKNKGALKRFPFEGEIRWEKRFPRGVYVSLICKARMYAGPREFLWNLLHRSEPMFYKKGGFLPTEKVTFLSHLTRQQLFYFFVYTNYFLTGNEKNISERNCSIFA